MFNFLKKIKKLKIKFITCLDEGNHLDARYNILYVVPNRELILDRIINLLYRK